MERMQMLRKKAGLTLKQLGKAVDKAESTISQYESGRREPDNETLLRIADVLGCSVDYLLGREDTKTPAPEGRGGEGADAAAADISEADVRAWLQAHGDELTPDEFVQLFGMGSSDAAILAICQLLPDEQKAALVEMVRSLAKSQGLIE
nr:MAG TPA: helix-turn-helix domain protein [Caudoviricetes sp.]